MISLSDLAAPDSGPIRFRRLQVGIAVLGVVVILGFAGSSAHDAWRSYQYSLASTDRELPNIAHALAEQTVWSLQSVDLLLLDTVRWYRSESQTIPPGGLDSALAARAAAVPQVRQVTIMDAQGNQVHRSRGFSIPNHNAADRSYFVAQRDDPGAGLFMSELLTTRSEGRAAVILSRRLDDDQGRFAGVVTANVDLEDLEQFYRAVDVGAGRAIQLVREDGTLLVRHGCDRTEVSRTRGRAGGTAGQGAEFDRRAPGIHRRCAGGTYAAAARRDARRGGRPPALAR